MNPKEKKRFAMLSAGHGADLDYIRTYYGLSWPLSGANAGAFEAFLRTSPKARKPQRKLISRIDIEGFMVLNDLSPMKWAAAQMGMSARSLAEVFKKIDGIGMLPSRYDVGDGFIADTMQNDLVRHLPGIRFRVFNDHTDFCRRLHAELQKTLSVTVEPLLCATSSALGEAPVRFASHFDCITLEPLSLYHSLWLNFRKPLNLPPDRCSKQYYAKNKGALSPFLLNPGEGSAATLREYGRSRVSA